MSDETWEMLVEQIARSGYADQVGLYLHHEPLLVNNLETRIRDINERTNAHVDLSTNGALLTPERRSMLIEAAPRAVHINISSADPTQYSDIMKLDWAVTRKNTHAFIEEAKDKIHIEINCPVLPEVDTQVLVDEFPGVKVNIEYWANSRGGLLEDVDASGKGSRFKRFSACTQPTQNLNVLWDGHVIVCCMDWMHESKDDFPSIFDADIFATFRGETMREIQREFRSGCYDRYEMCSKCAGEMGFNKGQPLTVLDDLHEEVQRVKSRAGSIAAKLGL